jgi:hypothetical protein
MERPGLVIVVPFRNRREQLAQFAPHMEHFLDAHPFRILVIEQADGKPFNRGALLNVGFHLAGATAEWVAFHDVDMLPLDASCDYSMPASGMRHLAGAAEQFGFTNPYTNYIGGVLLSTMPAFESMNGFSNSYWGWGCEDDDLFIRACACGVAIHRTSGRYRSLPHARPPLPVENFSRLATVVAHVLGAPDPVTNEQLRRIRRTDHADIRCVANARDAFMSDGLSSLRYRITRRTPLSDYLNHDRPIDTKHELVSVAL